jgi:hypothetical protein
MAVTLALVSCAAPSPQTPVNIEDWLFCAPFRVTPGAVCDSFLTANQHILDGPGWEAVQDAWMSQGAATVCTSSDILVKVKQEIEKLCSMTPCTYQQAQVIDSIRRILLLK